MYSRSIALSSAPNFVCPSACRFGEWCGHCVYTVRTHVLLCGVWDVRDTGSMPHLQSQGPCNKSVPPLKYHQSCNISLYLYATCMYFYLGRMGSIYFSHDTTCSASKANQTEYSFMMMGFPFRTYSKGLRRVYKGGNQHHLVLNCKVFCTAPGQHQQKLFHKERGLVPVL